MRLSTRDLFVVLTFVAVIAWCAGKVGYDSFQFWLSAIVSFLLAAAFVRWSAPERRKTVALTVALPLIGFFTLCIGSIATLVVAALLVLAAIVFRFTPPSSLHVRLRVAMLCISAAFIYAYIFGNGDVRRILAARKLFPLESIEQRLDYELTQTASRLPSSNDSLILLKLDNDEQGYDRNDWRGHQLRLIHSQEYERFVRAAGFGPVRMIRPRAESIANTPLRNIKFDDLTPADNEGARDWRAGLQGVTSGSIESAHEISRRDFLDPAGFGYIQTPRLEVAGFIEHAFHHNPLADDKRLSTWRLQRLELVSLLKFDEPRVYVLDHLPRMDQLSSDTAPTRPLNEFEASALQQLYTDKDLVVSEQGDEVQMLGSLRAARQCLDCHNVQRGELLGAFSYRLTLAEGTSDAAPVAVADAQP
jgi:hypothetical protein